MDLTQDKAGAPGRPLPVLLAGLLTGLLAGLLSITVLAAGFTISEVRSHLDNGVYLLNANIEYLLSDQALEALENGVTLEVVVEIEVLRERKYLWDASIATLRQRHKIKRHALSSRYILTNLNTGTSHSYASLTATLQTLGRIVDFPILDQHLTETPGQYDVRLRTRLDIEALPAPLRPLAYLSPKWRLTSDWIKQPLQQ